MSPLEFGRTPTKALELGLLGSDCCNMSKEKANLTPGIGVLSGETSLRFVATSSTLVRFLFVGVMLGLEPAALALPACNTLTGGATGSPLLHSDRESSTASSTSISATLFCALGGGFRRSSGG